MVRSELVSAASPYRPDGIPESRYLRAKEEWDRRIGSTVVQAKNWRLACIISLLLSALLAGGIIYQASLNKVVPLIIAVNEHTGEPRIIGKVQELRYEPQLQEIKYFLGEFVRKLRSVPSDPVLIRENWLAAYKFLRPKAAQILNDMTQGDSASPLKQIGEITVAVKLISVTKVGGDNSYQVRWAETVYSANGAALEKYTMNGVFTLEQDLPHDEATLLVNPLGLFITNFQWTRELTTGA